MKKSLLLMSALVLTSGVSFGTLKNVPVGAVKQLQLPSNIIRGNFTVDDEGTQPAKVRQNAGEDLSITFGYAGKAQDAVKFSNVPGGWYIYYAFEIPASDAAMFAGAKITGINITSGTNQSQRNPVNNVEVFVTEDISSLPANMQAATISSLGLRSKLVNLETPFEIKGDKSVYVGYRLRLPTSETVLEDFYYLPTDYIATSGNTYMVAAQESGTDTPEFSNYSDQIGSIPMSVEITNLNENKGVATDINLDRYFKFGKTISYELSVRNLGKNKITSIDAKTTINNGTVFEKTVNLTSPILVGETGVVTVTEVPNSKEGIFVISSQVSKINGEDVSSSAEMSAPFYTYSDGFTRIPVIEEGTGTWCGWCPRGIVMMEYLKENYPDWIRIAVHVSNGGSKDPMELKDYLQYVYDYISGFPGAVTNRYYWTNPAGADDRYYKPVDDYFKSFPAYCNISLTATPNENSTEVNVSSTSEFSIDTDVEHLLSFVVVEDGVGPYRQTNYYAGESSSMGGWESKPSSVSTKFDDVPRAIKSYPGIEGSLPAPIEKNSKYEYKTTLPLNLVKSDKYRVVGMITNGLTGEIVNACEVTVDESAINSIANDNESIDIRVVDGDIIVAGASEVAVYTLDGRKVGTHDLSNGVYIVIADGISKKVIVK